jgi:hypothetical protein
VARKRRVTYPPPKTATKGAPPPGAFDPRNPPGRTVSINLRATAGRTGIAAGDRVRILSGLYEGEIVTVESIAGGVIPAAIVRTSEGRTRRARTIDLEPVRSERAPTDAPPPSNGSGAAPEG